MPSQTEHAYCALTYVPDLTQLLHLGATAMYQLDDGGLWLDMNAAEQIMMQLYTQTGLCMASMCTGQKQHHKLLS